RTLLIQGDTLLDVVTVESTTGKPQKLGLAFHVQGKVALPDDFKSDKGFATGRPAPFDYWTDVREVTYQDEARFDVDYAGEKIRITFALPGAFRIWHASSPDSPPD